MEKVYEEVEALLEFIRNEMDKMDLDAQEVFLNGNCGNLYRIFVSQFPKYTTPFVISYKDIPFHLVTKIGDKLFDITGETSLDKYSDMFIKTENSSVYQKENFNIRQLSVSDPIIRDRYMCNMYRYNEAYEQSEIDTQMYKLLERIKQRECMQK